MMPLSPPEISTSGYLALIPYCGLFILLVYSIFLEWTQARGHETRPTSQAGPVRHHCTYGVSSAPALKDDPSPPPDDARSPRRSMTRGRRFSTATASTQGSLPHSYELFARAGVPSLIEEDQNQLDDNATNAKVPGSPSSHILSITVQAEPLADPSHITAETRASYTDSTAKRAWSTPIPEPSRAIHNRSPSRYESLPHDPNYERTPPHPTKTDPLKRALYAGSKDLTPPTIQWFILFIEVDDKRNSEYNPPERNVFCFQEMLKLPTTESTSIYFDSLAGHKATPEKIKTKIASLYMRAGCVCDDSLVLVFLTGIGDATNRMQLVNDTVLTEENLRDWVSDVRTRSGLTNVQTVPIIFDICRENKDLPSAKMHQVVELLWSCSLGQRAHAIGFPDVPNSCFLLALFWAAYDIAHSNSPDFEQAFRSRLGQLVRIRRHSHDYWLQESGECGECDIGEKCTSPGPQDPEGQQAGWDVVTRLGALIVTRYPDYVREVVAALSEEMRQCEIWEARQATSSTCGSQTAAVVQHVGSKEHRGSTQPVAAY